jgi:hypothetical protein
LAHLSDIEPVLDFPQFVFLTAGDGDATGEAVGLGLVAGVVTVLLGEAVGEGDDVTTPEFELFAGSQAAANSVNRMVGSSSARLIDLGFELLIRELLIRLPRSNKIEKREDVARTRVYQQWVFPQVFHRNRPFC